MPRTPDDATVITVKHWNRLFDGELYASSSRVEWAVLLRRTHGIDALACPMCESGLRPIATITDPPVATKILVHLGRRAEPLPRARARDPIGRERASTSTPPDRGDATSLRSGADADVRLRAQRSGVRRVLSGARRRHHLPRRRRRAADTATMA